MAGEKFIKNVSGVLTETVATQAGGAGSENLIPALDNTGRLNSTMLPVGVGDDANMILCVGTIADGDFVNIYSTMMGSPLVATAVCRKADASVSGKEANGFVLVGGTDEEVKVYSEGTNTQMTGLTPGNMYFLSDATAGKVVSAPPTGTGKVVQHVGRAVSATAINFEGQPVIVLA